MTSPKTNLEKFSYAAKTVWTAVVVFSSWAYETSAPAVGTAAAFSIRMIDRAACAVAKSAKDGYIADAFAFAKSSARGAVVWLSHKAFKPVQRKKGFELSQAHVFTLSGMCIDVTQAVKNMLEDEALDERWGEYVEPLVPVGIPTDEWRVEARYAYDGRKYRAVVPGESASFPGINEPARRAFPRVSSAALIFGKDKKVDITARVLKYMGPRGDWHGAPGGVKIVDMFPNDDVEDLIYKDCNVMVTGHCMRSEITKFEDGAYVKIP